MLSRRGSGQLSRYRDLLRYGWSGDRNPVGASFPAPVQTGRGAHPASCTIDTVCFPGVKRLGRGVDQPPHLAPRLRKEQSVTSTLRLGPGGLFQVEVYLNVFMSFYNGSVLLSQLLSLDCSRFHPFTGHEGPQREQRYSSTLFQTSALEVGEGSASRPGSTLPPGKTRYPFYRRLGGPQDRSGQVRKISPHRDSIPGPSSPQTVAIPTELPGPRGKILIISIYSVTSMSFTNYFFNTRFEKITSSLET